MDKERFVKLLNKKLTIDQKELFGMIEVEQQKETIVFRMPVGYVALDSVWEAITIVAQEHSVRIKQAGEYATLDELDDMLGNIEWLWNKWIPKGFVTMIAGDPGVGKSAVAQWLVKVVTEALPFPLEIAPQKKLGTAIWVDTEASHQLIKVRADSMQMDKKRVYLPVFMGDILSQADLSSGTHRDTIIRLVEGTEADLLVLDSLGGSHAKGENKVEDVRPILEFLTLLARDYKMAVIVVHHLNKGHKDESPEVSLYRLRGSTMIPAMCRSIIAVEPSYDSFRKMRMIKNNLAKAAEPITVIPKLNNEDDILGFEFKAYEAPAAKKTKKDMCADWIIDQLQKTKHGTTPAALVEWAGGMYTKQMIYNARDSLGDRISVSGTGHKTTWALTVKDMVSVKKILASNGNGKHPVEKKTGDKHGRAKAK